MKRILFVIVLLSLLTSEVHSQVYENTYRPNQKRFELQTPHFRVIFPAGEEIVARQTARILEAQYDAIQSLVGGSLKRFPVILNNHNDRSNGFVSPVNFRTEIEIPPILGLSMNPRTGGWMENVAPHELVHALQFSNIPTYSFAGLIGLAAPDLARSFHSIAPFGILEGIAVYQESRIVHNEGGRGNYPFFTNRVLSNLNSSSPWSLAQHLQPTRFNRPFDRHYSAGNQFVSWMQSEYGSETTRKAIEYFVKYPFLGFGFALRHATGQYPRALFRDYKTDQNAYLQEYLSRRKEKPITPFILLDTNIQEAEIRSPIWIDEETLLIYLPAQYQFRPGFYTLHIPTSSLQLLFETQHVNDYMFYYDEKERSIIYARYHVHPWYSNGAQMDVHQFKIESRDDHRITQGERLHHPFLKNGKLHALQNTHDTSQWVSLNEDGKSEPVAFIYPDHIHSVVPMPGEADRFAVIANKNGVQALWLASLSEAESKLNKKPTIAFTDASILDANWSMDGKRLYFSADIDGVINVYMLELDENRVFQITNSLFNAFQPAESPDGKSLVIVVQQGNAQVPALLHSSDFLMDELPENVWQESLSARFEKPRLGSEKIVASNEWPVKQYKTGFSWLRPRVALPFSEPGDGQIAQRYGLTVWGTDIYGKHSYSLDITTSNNHIWADFLYRNTTFYPGFELEFFHRPRSSSSGLIMERGGGLTIPFTFSTEANSRFSWFTFRPGFKLRELKLDFSTVAPDEQDQFRRDWLTDPSLTAFISYNHRLQQNIRDIQPNTGTVLFWQGEQFIGTDRAANPSGMRAGIIKYLSPMLEWNHGLQVRIEFMTQTKNRVFNTSNLVSNGFGENVLSGLNNAGSFSTRYVLPLAYIDNGWILVPLFFERVYLSLMTNTVANLNEPLDNRFVNATRTVFGVELRTDMRFFNMPLNIGIGLGWEPTRNHVEIYGDGSTL